MLRYNAEFFIVHTINKNIENLSQIRDRHHKLWGGRMKSKFHINTTKWFSFLVEKLKYYAY